MLDLPLQTLGEQVEFHRSLESIRTFIYLITIICFSVHPCLCRVGSMFSVTSIYDVV